MTEFSLSTLSAVVEHLPVPVVLTTCAGVIVTASPASRAFIGLAKAGEQLELLLERTSPEAGTSSVEIRVDDADPHLLTSLETPPPPQDVAALARETAHDFNNLLGVIINFASLAATEVPEGGNAAADLQEVLVASRRAARLTQRLLQIAVTTPDPAA